MSGLELAGFVIGVLGPLEQSITLINLLRNHLKSYQANENIIKQLLPSMSQLQSHLQQLETQLQQYNHFIPSNNYDIFKTHLAEMRNIFNTIHQSMTDMEQSAKRRTVRFRKATKWAEELESIQSKINDAQYKILHINSFLGQTSVVTSTVTSTVKESEQSVIQTIESQKASSSTDQPRDEFKSYFQKLPVSNAAKSNFHSLDSYGNPLTTEAKLTNRLLTPVIVHQTKIFAIHGPGGVGKTTCMHMLSHEPRIRKHFVHGIHYVKLGADAKAETAMNQIANVIRHSGGLKKANEIESMKSIDEVIGIASEWFMDKKILLLVDDVWERKKVGAQLISQLKEIMSGSDEGGIVFTTRDSAIATESLEAFPLNCRDPEGEESRAILFQHARQNPKSTYGEAAEGAIKSLLHTCGGLPVAHSVVGKGVLQYSMRRKVGQEVAWQLYALRQTNILKGKADDYDNLCSVFEAAICFLDEDETMKTHDTSEMPRTYSYGELHRSLSVFEKQEWVPLKVLGCMWNIESEEDVREICENLVRVGIAEWHNEEEQDDQVMDAHTEGISIHDLLHDFATQEATRHDEVEAWHRRIVEGYANRNDAKKNGDKLQEWWNIGNLIEEKDGGYFMRRICRHLYLGGCERNEIVMLVTRPEWIRSQLSRNGVLQYEIDARYGIEWLKDHGEEGELGVKELEMIRDATRLSASYILKNGEEVWFQLYGRLMRRANTSEGIQSYLLFVEKNAPRPWVKPIDRSDGLLTSVGSGGIGLVNVGKGVQCMIVLRGEEEVMCGCRNGEIVIVNLKENVVKKRWKGHDTDVIGMVMVDGGNHVVSACYDGLWKVWNTENWELVRSSDKSIGWKVNLGMSRDERRLYLSDREESIEIWDFVNGNLVGNLDRTVKTDASKEKTAVDALKQGKGILTIVGANAVFWKFGNEDENEIATGLQPKHEEVDDHCIVNELEVSNSTNCAALNSDESQMIVSNSTNCAALNSDESQMIVASDNGVELWDAKDMKRIENSWNVFALNVNCVAFSMDGTKIVWGYLGGLIEVRDLTTGGLVCPPFKHSDHVNRVSFMEGDDRIVSCSNDGTVRTWKINELSELLNDEADDVMCVRCSPDETFFITGHQDGSLWLWDVASGHLIRKSPQTHEWIVAVAVTPDCQRIISVDYSHVFRIWHRETLQFLCSFRNDRCERVPSFAEVSNTGQFAVTCSDLICVWNLKKCDGSKDIVDLSKRDCYIFRSYISNDEKRIVAVILQLDGWFIEVWSIENWELVRRVQLSQAPIMVREEIMSAAQEPQAKNTSSLNNIFFRHGTRELRYGNGSHSVVLGTGESDVDSYAHSPKHQIAAVVLANKLRFLKLEL